jgi:hypothetical protein
MRRQVLNSVIVVLVVLVVIGLNVLLYTEEDSYEDERTGSRSTNSARPYGTRGFYVLLQELGYEVTQLEESLPALPELEEVGSLFIIGPPIPYAQEELTALEEWVEAGGYLVIVDREIDWPIADGQIKMSTYSKFKQWRRPQIEQPTAFTAGVDHVQLTEFARGVKAENAPIIKHVGDQDGPVLIDFRYGDGRIVLLGEPYMVANNGIMAADNLTLMLNIVRSMPEGVIAFDEYHHGYGGVYSRGVVLNLYDYFKGTPVLWVFLQLSLAAAAMIYSRGRRFARPVPLPEPRRTRSLEYVASFASLAHRMESRRFALENLYRAFRRRVSAAGGVGGERAERASLHHRRAEVNQALARCEQVLNDRSIADSELIRLARQLRSLEAELRRMR